MPKHKFPDRATAQQFSNHCWRHNAFMGGVRWAINRLSGGDTLHNEDKANLAQAIICLERILYSGRRDDSRFKQWEI